MNCEGYNSSAMSVVDAGPFEILSKSLEQTRRIGEGLGAALKAGDVICLQGELGAGKTTLVQGLAQGWGSLDSVSSPTFILVNVYRRADGAQMFHLDTYRLGSVPEAEELDLDSMLVQGALIIEWPERLGDLIPDERLWVNLEHRDEGQRQIRFNPRGTRYEELLDAMRRSMVGVN